MSTAAKKPTNAANLAVDLNLDAYEAAEELKPFVVTVGGKPYQFEHMDSLDAWDVVDAFMGGEVAATVDILAQALGGPEEYAKFRKATKGLPKSKFDHLVRSYMAHSGVNLGE